MAELMSLIALASMLAAVAAGWYLWRVLSWHPHGGLTPARVAAEPIAWRMPERRPEPELERVTVALSHSTREDVTTEIVTRPDPLNRRANAGRWSSDATAGNGPATGFRRVNGIGVNGMGVNGMGVMGVNGANADRHVSSTERSPACEPTGGEAQQVTREELRLALRAVLVHTPQQWPGGLYCSNDRSPFPCRMRHWGEQVLLAAGWDADGIDAMARQADAGLPPWLAAGAGDATPPR